MEATVVRYCPKCGVRVQAPEDLFSTPCRCPSCGERSQFYDYPNEPTPTPAKASGRYANTWMDRLLWAVVVLAIFCGALAVWTLFNEKLSLTVAAGVVCLLAGLGCTGFILVLRRRVDRAFQDKKKFERALKVSNSKVAAAAEVNAGFKKNFDALVQEAKNRELDKLNSREERAREIETEATKHVTESLKVLPTMDLVANRLLEETVYRLSKDLNSSNLAESRRQLKYAISFCRENGAKIKSAHENELINQLEMDHQSIMLEAKYKNERLMVEAKMREEQRAIEEVEHDLRSAEAERSSIAKSLSAILRDSEGASDSKIDELREKLRLAEQKMSEASSVMRTPTAGHFYVLSNVGSFGKGIYLIGSTRMANPKQFVEELSGIAVPFPFDIHMLVPSPDAEDLARKVRESLHERRLNRFNHGRSFFKCDLKEIWQQVVAFHGTIDYQEVPDAEEYRESCRMSDQAFQHMTDMHRDNETYRDPLEVRSNS